MVKGSTGKRNSKNVPYTQFYATTVADAAGRALYSFVSLQPVTGSEAEPSQTMVSTEMRERGFVFVFVFVRFGCFRLRMHSYSLSFSSDILYGV